MLIDTIRARFFVRGMLSWLRSFEKDHPKEVNCQSFHNSIRDLRYLLESLGYNVPEDPHCTAQELYQKIEFSGDNPHEDPNEEWPKSSEAFYLSQVLMGAVMPSSMFYTSWPAEYYEMMTIGRILARRREPEVLELMNTGIRDEFYAEEAKKKTDGESTPEHS